MKPIVKEALVSDSKTDEVKGRTKEAAGSLGDDKGLKREGKIDHASGSMKEKAEGAADKAKDTFGKGG